MNAAALALAAARVVPMVLWIWPRALGGWPRVLGAIAATCWVATTRDAAPAEGLAGAWVVRELAIGAAVGLTAAQAVRGAEVAARLISPGAPVMTQALVALSWATFAAVGGIDRWMAAIAQSYARFAVGQRVPLDEAIAAVGALWGLAIELALPVVIALAAAEAMRALIVRVEPVLREVLETRATAIWVAAGAVSVAATAWVLRLSAAVGAK